MNFDQLKELYALINSMKDSGLTDLDIVKWLQTNDYEAETAFWLIDKAAGAK